MKYRFSEVLDSPEHARSFMDLNLIKPNQIVAVIVVWDDYMEEKK